MTKEQNAALVEMMNAAMDERRLAALADEVFNGVVPLRNRAQQDQIVKAAVALLAAGSTRQSAVQALETVSSLNWDHDRLDALVGRVCEVAAAKAAMAEKREPDLVTALKAALSYAGVIDGRSNPSPELEALVAAREDRDYNNAGMDAMLGVMRFLSNPDAYPLTPETVRLADALSNAARSKAFEAAHGGPDDTLTDLVVEENGKMFAVIEDRHGVRNVEIHGAVPAPESETELGM